MADWLIDGNVRCDWFKKIRRRHQWGFIYALHWRSLDVYYYLYTSWISSVAEAYTYKHLDYCIGIEERANQGSVCQRSSHAGLAQSPLEEHQVSSWTYRCSHLRFQWCYFNDRRKNRSRSKINGCELHSLTHWQVSVLPPARLVHRTEILPTGVIFISYSPNFSKIRILLVLIYFF
jgi:hypothetical protein